MRGECFGRQDLARCQPHRYTSRSCRYHVRMADGSRGTRARFFSRLLRPRRQPAVSPVEAAEPSVCLCTLAIHAPYRERARMLFGDSPHLPWFILTDEPTEFAEFAPLGLRTRYHEPTGPMAVDYVERLPPTGVVRGAAAYHDKRFALIGALEQHDTAIFLDADSRISDRPVIGPFPHGICVLPQVDNTVRAHLGGVGSWRLPAFVALAEHLTGGTEILDSARWCQESCIAITRDGREDAFFEAWGRAADFLQEREVFSGEGGVIGFAAVIAGWSVDTTSLLTFATVVQHEGGGPKSI
jgi:hypothetical protein